MRTEGAPWTVQGVLLKYQISVCESLSLLAYQQTPLGSSLRWSDEVEACRFTLALSFVSVQRTRPISIFLKLSKSSLQRRLGPSGFR